MTTGPDWFARVPKVELHLHLEGAIPLPALWMLLHKYGGDTQIPDIAALERRFTYSDFPHFLDTWIWKNGFLREHEDVTFIAEAAARALAAQHIRYAEMFYSPPDFAHHGLTLQRLTEAIRHGLDQAPGIEIALVADVVRHSTPQQAAVTVEQVHEVQALGVIGIGLGGSEQKFPPGPFKPVYELARRYGLHGNVHAGEAAEAASIWSALRDLGAERIGHATRASEDEALLDFLAEKQIPLEMCPISNLRTGVVATIESHPIRKFFERGLLITVNTDDPKMFNNSLAEEYHLLETRLGFSRDEIRQLILQGIRAAWLPEERKRALIDSFCMDPNWLK